MSDIGTNEYFTVQADLQLAVEAAQAACTLLKTFMGADKPAATFKLCGGPVTEADLALDRLLHQQLTVPRPHYGWLSEESADGPARLKCDRVWIVDPIDGTRAFIKGKPEFTISIGLVEKGRPLLGVVANPSTNELFEGGIGLGARLNGVAIYGSNPQQLSGANVLVSSGDLQKRVKRAGDLGINFHHVSSVALKMCLVAVGRYDGYFSLGAMGEWDCAGGAAIALAAGLDVMHLDGSPLVFNRRKPEIRTLLVGNQNFLNLLRPPLELIAS